MKTLNWNKELLKFYNENSNLNNEEIAFKFVIKYCINEKS